MSAYALIVEDGTKLARQIRRGELAEPSDDLEADMYELADELLGGAGYDWYEVSNWATDAAHRSRHNLGYWRGDDWWGVGPGAHSHVGGVRWWNAKHPAAYAERVTAGVSPAVGRELLDAPDPRDRAGAAPHAHPRGASTSRRCTRAAGTRSRASSPTSSWTRKPPSPVC